MGRFAERCAATMATCCRIAFIPRTELLRRHGPRWSVVRAISTARVRAFDRLKKRNRRENLGAGDACVSTFVKNTLITEARRFLAYLPAGEITDKGGSRCSNYQVQS